MSSREKKVRKYHINDGQASPTTSDPNNDYKLVEEKISYVNVFFFNDTFYYLDLIKYVSMMFYKMVNRMPPLFQIFVLNLTCTYSVCA